MLVTVSFIHIKLCNTSIESFNERLHFFFYTDELCAICEDVMTKKHEKKDDLTVFCAI